MYPLIPETRGLPRNQRVQIEFAADALVTVALSMGRRLTLFVDDNQTMLSSRPLVYQLLEALGERADALWFTSSNPVEAGDPRHIDYSTDWLRNGYPQWTESSAPSGVRPPFIVYVTDCVSEMWGQQMPSVLTDSGRKHPTIILNVLPGFLWPASLIGATSFKDTHLIVPFQGSLTPANALWTPIPNRIPIPVLPAQRSAIADMMFGDAIRTQTKHSYVYPYDFVGARPASREAILGDFLWTHNPNAFELAAAATAAPFFTLATLDNIATYVTGTSDPRGVVTGLTLSAALDLLDVDGQREPSDLLYAPAPEIRQGLLPDLDKALATSVLARALLHAFPGFDSNQFARWYNESRGFSEDPRRSPGPEMYQRKYPPHVLALAEQTMREIIEWFPTGANGFFETMVRRIDATAVSMQNEGNVMGRDRWDPTQPGRLVSGKAGILVWSSTKTRVGFADRAMPSGKRSTTAVRVPYGVRVQVVEGDVADLVVKTASIPRVDGYPAKLRNIEAWANVDGDSADVQLPTTHNPITGVRTLSFKTSAMNRSTDVLIVKPPGMHLRFEVEHCGEVHLSNVNKVRVSAESASVVTAMNSDFSCSVAGWTPKNGDCEILSADGHYRVFNYGKVTSDRYADVGSQVNYLVARGGPRPSTLNEQVISTDFCDFNGTEQTPVTTVTR